MSLLADRRAVRSRWWAFWLLWIAPAFVFMWLVDSTEPGHDLVFSVALCVLSAGLLVASMRRVSHLLICAAFIVAAQAGIFLFASPVSEKPPASEGCFVSEIWFQPSKRLF